MQRKWTVIFAVLVLLSLVVAPVGIARAQDPQPPTPISDPPTPPHYPPMRDLNGYGGTGKGVIPHASEGSIQNDVQAAVALGEPGLSYRYVKTFGETEVAYLADTAHLNYPYGLGTYGNNVWIAELWGNRAVKYSNAGSFQQQIGIAGVVDVYDYQTALGEIADVAVDGTGNIWVVDDGVAHVAKFDSAGNFVGELGVLGVRGTDNDHFDTPMSIAFDANGNIYVSDGAPWWNWDIGNHRIQVFDSSGNYLTTIGETGVADVDNNHFHGPRHITVDGDQLFVADAGNQRIQIFNITNAAAPVYEATIGVSGEEGSDTTHFSNPSGVAFDADYIYVADSWNNRVQVFDRGPYSYVATIGTGWGTGNYQFRNPSDVAIDLAGKLYVADFVNTRVQQYNRSGATWTYARKYGATNVPYLTDGYHYNRPSGVAIANDNSIYIIEEAGHRLVKLNAAGTPLWMVGQAGVKGDWNDSNTHLNNPADVALDAAGHVYVADRWYGRVKIFNPNGSVYNEINSLGCPGGVTVAPNGQVYVADSCNQTVNIYNSNLSLAATLGTPGESGSDNAHFNWPEDVAVDSNGNIFVADQGNQRIQVFNSNWIYVRTMGVIGECGNQFDHFCNPNGLSVDSLNRLYVADQDNNRIQVFDESGAYLTTIAGGWGTNSGQVRAAMGVAVDTAGNVYIADYAENHRIQKFAPGIPNWKQVNINGFGDKNNWATHRMSVFNGYLYASTNNGNTGGEVWRTTDGHTWTQVNSDGFGDASNAGVLLDEAFNGYLYAGTSNSGTGAELWRCTVCDGTDWSQVVTDGFGDANNTTIERVVVFSNTLYATTNNINGVEVWKSSTGDLGSWAQANTDGFGDAQNTGLWAAAVFNNYLYAATSQWDAFNNGGTQTGLEVWRTNNGVNWNQVNTDGFGNNNNFSSWLESFNGYLYTLSGGSTSSQIWRCATCDGSDWVQVVSNGFGDGNNTGGGFMLGFGNYFYAGTSNDTGTEIWRTANGTAWSQVNVNGFGDSNNVDIWGGAVFNENLFLGTRNGWDNSANSGQVWMWLKPEIMNINTITDTGDGSLSEGEKVIVPVTKLKVTFNKDVTTPKVADFALMKGTTIITINSVSYDSPTRTVTLNINGGKKLSYGAYALTLKNTISDTENNKLNTNFVRKFSLVKPPSVPSLISPINNALLTNLQPKLDWSNSAIPAGTVFDHYQIQLATDAAFTIPVDQNTAISEFTPAAPLTPDTKYYWRVRAYNTLGQASAWSVVGTFREAMLPPNLVAPADGDPAGTRKPTLDWTDVVNNTGYTIQVSVSPSFGTLLINVSTTTGVSTYTPITNLPAGKTLYWRVRAKGLNGPSAWSTVFSFTTP